MVRTKKHMEKALFCGEWDRDLEEDLKKYSCADGVFPPSNPLLAH